MPMPRRDTLPLDLLLAKEDPASLPRGLMVTKEQSKQARRDADWAGKREHVFAAVAAGFHLSVFAFNLAFWGFEGQAPDRYWPENPRCVHAPRAGPKCSMHTTAWQWMHLI